MFVSDCSLPSTERTLSRRREPAIRTMARATDSAECFIGRTRRWLGPERSRRSWNSLVVDEGQITPTVTPVS